MKPVSLLYLKENTIKSLTNWELFVQGQQWKNVNNM